MTCRVRTLGRREQVIKLLAEHVGPADLTVNDSLVDQGVQLERVRAFQRLLAAVRRLDGYKTP